MMQNLSLLAQKTAASLVERMNGKFNICIPFVFW